MVCASRGQCGAPEDARPVPKATLAAIAAATFIAPTGLARLPPAVALHFDAAGAANGFMPRGTYLALMTAVAAGVPLLLGGIGRRIGGLPPGLVNLPNKDYWLAPERRDASLASLSARMQWFAMATAVFLCCVHWLVVRANASPAPHLAGAPFAIALAAFLLFTAGWLAALLAKFARRP